MYIIFAVAIIVAIIFWSHAISSAEPESTIISWIACAIGFFFLLSGQIKDTTNLSFFTAVATIICNLPPTLIAWSKRKKIDEKYKR